MKQIRRFAWTLFWLFASGCCALTLALSGAQNARIALATQGGTAQAEMRPSKALEGMVIAIDAGHGGYDGGAVGRRSRVQEKDLNLDVAMCLRLLLRSQGAQVIMTRAGDYALCDADPPIRKKLQDMQRRAALVVQGKADLLLSIHMNEYASGSQSGPQVFYRKDCPAGRALAALLQDAMVEELAPCRRREINTGDYYILTLGVPSALIECGFLSNAQEEELLRDAGYRARIARSICQGVLAWAAQAERPVPLPAQQR